MRSVRRAWVVAVTVLVLAGCGFHLRGEATFTFESLYLNSSGSPQFNNEMRRAL